MTAPQGADLQFGYGFESADNQPATIDHFLRPMSIAGAKPKRTNEDPANIDPNGQALKPIKVAAALDTVINHQPDVDSIAPLLAHHAGFYKITALITAPGAPTVALAGLGAGALDLDDYYYKVTFVTADGETEAGTASAVVTPTGGDGQVAVSSIPVGPTGTTARKIYRTEGGATTYKLLATISDNTTTTYADNNADAALGATAPTTNDAGPQQWEIYPNTFSGASTAPASVTHEVDNGDGYPILTSGNRYSDLQIKIVENKLQQFTLKSMGCYDTYLDDLTIIQDNGSYTGGGPLIRGHRSDPTSANIIKVKCTTGGALDGTAKVKFTTGSTAYGSTEYAVYAGVWMRVILADGSHAGHSRFETVWVMFPAGGTLTSTGTPDEWSFASARTAATASYSALNPLNAAGVEVTLDSVVYDFHSCDIAIATPRKAKNRIGSYYRETIQPNGKKTAMITFDRDYEDRNLLLALIGATSISVSVSMYGDRIGATAYDELHQLNFPNCIVVEQDQDVTNEQTLPEKIVLHAFRSGSTAIYNHLIQGTLNTI